MFKDKSDSKIFLIFNHLFFNLTHKSGRFFLFLTLVKREQGGGLFRKILIHKSEFYNINFLGILNSVKEKS
ncbi:hypothetical protein COB21_05800 [Candidatus Aerophobetes bacterium]|uniref:Uncharacterized protein n=1 Tax=Aerophobetes bacterium TaxID=2030807 RepID=A0A2A4WYL1_UNCAE|nr:MAG: hypothetical protein COB21_05800 [Candidatus Aerophobetes bacterium]